MKFLDAEFVQGFIRMADDGWQQGWHERNGGNLTYRLKPRRFVKILRPGSGSPLEPAFRGWQGNISW